MGNWNISKDTFGGGYTARPGGGSGQGSVVGLWAVYIIGFFIIISVLVSYSGSNPSPTVYPTTTTTVPASTPSG